MPTPPRYWTPEFIELYVEALNEDPEFQKTAGSFTDTIVLRCLDTPDGKDMEASYEFDQGEVVNVDLWIEDAPSEDMRNDRFDKHEALARATATYGVWTRLDRGEMSVMQALASPDYTIEGPKLKILTNMGIFNGMSDVASRVEKTY